ncbi:MAG: hypothetical protein EU551_01490 [Promethearchaeota archaeon]|nr:MAG: hypothetical protein EU551_01490 [Candidatus Lokiarchaeota archaeon]
MIEIITIGIDIGGYIKFSRKDIKIAIPNVIGSRTSGWSGLSSDESWINNLVLIQDGSEFFIGELARSQSDVKHFIMDQGRLDKIDEVFKLIKAVLPLISIEEEKDIVLAIGVPLSTSIEKMKELSRLKGPVAIKIKNESTDEIKEVELNLKQILVMPEAYGSYYYHVAKYHNSRTINALVISLDLLTEIMTVVEGRIIRQASVNLTNASLFVLANKISLGLQQQTNQIIKPLSIMKNLRDNIDEVIISGKRYNITEIREHYIRQISQEIVDSIKNILNFLPLDLDIEYYIITGEAVPIFWNEIEMLILTNNLIKDLDRIMVIKDHSFANAIGFELMGEKKISTSKEDE